MKKVLLVESSPRGEMSESRKLTRSVEKKLKDKYSQIETIKRDLSTSQIPHLAIETIQDFYSPPDKISNSPQSSVQLSNKLVDEVKESDLIVIATPIWNFGVPSALKAWIDHVCRAGKTFSYTDKGPQGLLQNKKVVLLLASGGVFSSGPYQPFDHTEPYLRHVLNFLGITDIQTVRVEGLSMPDMATIAVQAAEKAVSQLVL